MHTWMDSETWSEICINDQASNDKDQLDAHLDNKTKILSKL